MISPVYHSISPFMAGLRGPSVNMLIHRHQGYFPYELKQDYPDGVMLKAWLFCCTHENRHVGKVPTIDSLFLATLW